MAHPQAPTLLIILVAYSLCAVQPLMKVSEGPFQML